jgi:hypothetical protein
VKHSGYYFIGPTPDYAISAVSLLDPMEEHPQFKNSENYISPLPTSNAGRPRRLLHTHYLRLVDFNEEETIPPYAILSHRWVEGEEVSFEEFRNAGEETQRKRGYAKIYEACVEATTYGLDFIWIDTCCINNGDHEEVARNIKSMYAYYENAYICLVYLADVEGYHDFELSSWFKRGWTLQELLAPRTVMFFSRGWILMGCKHGSRSSAVCRATSIAEDVLQEKMAIKDVGLLEKMAWAMGRETTKAPDQAYCLLGILGVSMEPDYNESGREAFQRLQKILVQTYPRYTVSFGRFASLWVMKRRHRLAPTITALRRMREWILDLIIIGVPIHGLSFVMAPFILAGLVVDLVVDIEVFEKMTGYMKTVERALLRYRGYEEED